MYLLRPIYSLIYYVNVRSIGSGFTGAFTLTPDDCSNDYFQNLVAYENVTDYQCDYFAPGMIPADRATTCCHPTNQDNDTAGIMQLPTDRALLLDAGFRDVVVKFANDKALFFDQYAKSFKKMSELGRDISVQWCDYIYDSNETMPDKAVHDPAVEAVLANMEQGGRKLSGLRNP